MTNEQTLIHLRGLRGRIVQAVEEAKKLMPENAERVTDRPHIEGFDPMHRIGCFPMLTPSHYVEVPIGFAALQPLWELINSIDEDIALLRPAEKGAA